MLKIQFILKILVTLSLVSKFSNIYAAENSAVFLSKWKKLLLYKDDLKKGLIDNKDFYVEKNGRYDYLAELKKFKFLLKENKKYGTHKLPLTCTFPARTKLIQQYFPNTLIKHKKCNDFEPWFKSLDAKSISLVYSSAYPNNPSSMFGHLLLKINKYPISDNKKNLLNYAVTFSAEVSPNDSGAEYAIKGLLGGYLGQYSLAPFYMKINTYNNVESRDLWEYELNYTPSQINLLVSHLWELYLYGQAKYFFATLNCSSFLMELLSLPLEENILTSSPYWYELPTEIIKRPFLINDFVRKTYYYPGKKKVFYASLPKDKSSIKKAIKTNNPDVVKDKDLYVLLHYFEYLKFKQEGKLNKQQSKFKFLLQKRIAKSNTMAISQKVARPIPPENSHSPMRFDFGLKQVGETEYLTFSHKQGFHDLFDNDQATIEFSEINFLKLDFELDLIKKDLSIDEIRLIDVNSIYEYNFFDPQFSWKLRSGVTRVKSYNMRSSHQLELNAASGVAKKFNHFLVNFYLGIDYRYSNFYKHNHNLLNTFELASYLSYKKIKIGLELKHLLPLLDGNVLNNSFSKLNATLSFHTGLNTQIRFISSYFTLNKSFDRRYSENEINFNYSY